MLKALTAAAANYGSPMLWIEDNGLDTSKIQSKLIFKALLHANGVSNRKIKNKKIIKVISVS